MRIAVVNWSRCRAGGAESYLARVVPALRDAGHEISFWWEVAGPHNRDPLPLPDGIPGAAAVDLGGARWLTTMRDWRPDVIYAHGLTDPDLDRRLTAIAPVAFFAHAYYGTCVSGTKSWSVPGARPCSRRFGPGCLGHYYPHRCGGLHPGTMLRAYRTQRRRLRHLRSVAAIVTASDHMRREYVRHGVDESRVHSVPLPVPPAPGAPHTTGSAGAWHLVFAGRMDRVKGGDLLLRSLPAVRQRVDRPLEVTMLGDGPERSRWMRAAAGLPVSFPGWVDDAHRERVLAAGDLFVLPSVWPEPFGLAGLEAGSFGLPTAAFAVGGIGEWLRPGVNGYLGDGNRPAAHGLTDAIVRCLDPSEHGALRRGAVETAARYTDERHLDALVPVLARCAA